MSTTKIKFDAALTPKFRKVHEGQLYHWCKTFDTPRCDTYNHIRLEQLFTWHHPANFNPIQQSICEVISLRFTRYFLNHKGTVIEAFRMIEPASIEDRKVLAQWETKYVDNAAAEFAVSLTVLIKPVFDTEWAEVLNDKELREAFSGRDK